MKFVRLNSGDYQAVGAKGDFLIWKADKEWVAKWVSRSGETTLHLRPRQTLLEMKSACQQHQMWEKDNASIKYAQSKSVGEFIIDRKLPSLNDYIFECRANVYRSAKMKKELEEQIGVDIIEAMLNGTMCRFDSAVRISFVWHERTRKRDADNIASAKKFILDAMQKTGVIPNDSRKYVTGFTDEFVDDKADYVKVKVYEV